MANTKTNAILRLQEDLLKEDKNRESGYLHSGELHTSYFSQNLLRMTEEEYEMTGQTAVIGRQENTKSLIENLTDDGC
jgi:hypothetical protein